MTAREELIKNIKYIGESLIENAENIVGNHKFLMDLRITCYPSNEERYPYYSIDKEILPEEFIEEWQKNKS